MLNKSVARRYAEAFFSIAREEQQIDKFQLELQAIVDAINEVEGLAEYFNHLLIPAKEKKEIAVKIFSGKISSITMNFLMMVLDKRRQSYLESILEEYKDMANEVKNIIKGDLVSAQEVPAAEIKSLAEKLSASTGKTVQLKQTVDPSLLGGIKIRIGDQIMDGTIAKKLEMLKMQLKQAKIS